ncbi:EAL domain-containing protein, partial [Salmonella enterica]|uniref:EAL domain-containing protein n=1 Tax=Salmonella enterica TaxID=28901 RepID=UPI00398C6EA9
SQGGEKLSQPRYKSVLIAIDEFGDRFYSLSYLQQLPVGYLKIDRTFIDTIDTSSDDVTVLDTIITLSQRLGLNVVAEGVSTQHQLRYILSNGVGFVQGFLYARPMGTNDFMSWLGKSAQRQNGLLKG